jgi:hypothetical protein
MTDLYLRDAQEAFNHAIKTGALKTLVDIQRNPPTISEISLAESGRPEQTRPCVGDYMYMYSDNVPYPGNDYFKNIITRKWITVTH